MWEDFFFSSTIMNEKKRIHSFKSKWMKWTIQIGQSERNAAHYYICFTSYSSASFVVAFQTLYTKCFNQHFRGLQIVFYWNEWGKKVYDAWNDIKIASFPFHLLLSLSMFRFTCSTFIKSPIKSSHTNNVINRNTHENFNCIIPF